MPAESHKLPSHCLLHLLVCLQVDIYSIKALQEWKLVQHLTLPPLSPNALADGEPAQDSVGAVLALHIACGAAAAPSFLFVW